MPTINQLIKRGREKQAVRGKSPALERSPLARHVRRLYADLERRGISTRPHVWLSEEWFSPDGIPGIAIPFRQQTTPPSLWGLWDAIRIPTLVLRGSRSDLLSPATAAEMSARGPRPKVVEFDGVGHAPMLFAREQIEPVVAFLGAAPSSG